MRELPGKVSGLDPIAVVESAYRLDEPSAWLNAMAQAARLDLDYGYGAQACVFHWATPNARPSMVAVAGTPPGMADYLRRINDHGPDEKPAQLLLKGPPRLYSFRELATPYGLEDFFLPHPLGDLPPFRDWGSVMITEPGITLLFGGMSAEPLSITAESRRRWSRLAVHVAAAFRLVMRLGGAPVGRVDAVLEPDGRCAHAEGDARARSARDALRSAARRIDRARGPLRRRDGTSALELWRGLVDGRWSLVDRFESDGRRYVVALRNDRRLDDPRALTPRQRQVAHLVASGYSNKDIAYDLGLSSSVVSTHVAAVLRRLGFRRREELVAAFPAGDMSATTAAIGDDTIAVASKPAEPLPIDGLSPAEQEIMAEVVRGRSDREIANRRGVAPRTVANQLRSVFRKLGVQSRVELVAKVGRGR